MPKMKYNKNQLEAAAKFIFENNKALVDAHSIEDWQGVQKLILDHMLEQLNKKNNWSATCGWILVFSEEFEHIECEIFVDANIAGEYDFSGEIS
jgi:hypothetical protein